MNWRVFLFRAALIAILPMVLVESIVGELTRAVRNINISFELRRQMRKWREEWRGAA